MQNIILIIILVSLMLWVSYSDFRDKIKPHIKSIKGTAGYSDIVGCVWAIAITYAVCGVFIGIIVCKWLH